MAVFLLFSQFLITHALAIAAPNLNFLGLGYDILMGNPLTTRPTEAPDPGYRQAIFDMSSETKTIEMGDKTWTFPDGVEIYDCGSCTTSFSSSISTGAGQYSAQLKESATLSASGNFESPTFSGTASFTGSSDYKALASSTSSQETTYVSTSATCCLYRAALELSKPPSVQPAFLTAVSRLPLSYDTANITNVRIWNDFFNTFGTHYTSEVMMGSRFGMQSKFDSRALSRASSSAFSMSASASLAAKYDALVASGGIQATGSYMSESERSAAQQFSSSAQERVSFSVGGNYPPDGEVSTWLESSSTKPMPVKTKLNALPSVLKSRYFPSDAFIAQKYTASVTALANYCEFLRGAGALSSCAAPSQTGHTSRTRGLFFFDACKEKSAPNPYTKGLNCPMGYEPLRVALIPTSVSNPACGGSLYVCYNGNGVSGSFGGCWQEYNGLLPSGNVLPVNPFTNAKNCPTGYRVIDNVVTSKYPGVGTLGGSSAVVKCCYSNSNVATTVDGGIYVTVEAASGGGYYSSNLYSKSLSCPFGYQESVVAKFINLEDVPSKIVACLSDA